MPALYDHWARCALVRWIFVVFKILSIETSRNGSYQFVESKSRICESCSGSSNKYFRSEGNSGRDENQFGSEGDDEDVSWTFLWPCGVDRRRAKKPAYENIYICTGCIAKGFVMPKSYLLQAVQSLIIITPAWPYTDIIIGIAMPGIVQNMKTECCIIVRFKWKQLSVVDGVRSHLNCRTAYH